MPRHEVTEEAIDAFKHGFFGEEDVNTGEGKTAAAAAMKARANKLIPTQLTGPRQP